MEEYLDQPWVIFSLKKETYAVPSGFVKSMVAMPEVVEVPNVPPYVRGVINLRGQVTPITDLRHRLGMPSYLDKIQRQIEMLSAREADHLHWLNELKSSVEEERPFALATDPHKCKFGQWYDSYKPKSFEEGQFLAKFVTPHKRIHGVAARVKAYVEGGEVDKAHELIERTRENELAEMIELFEQFREMTRRQASQEIAVVLEHDSKRTAVAVDSVDGVEKLARDTLEPLDNIQDELAASMAKTARDSRLVFLVDAKTLVAESCSCRRSSEG